MGNNDKHEIHDTKTNNDAEYVEEENVLMEQMPDGQRVMLRVSERLREFMEYDHYMITQQHRQHDIPARVAVVSLLEHCVKENAVKLVSALTPVESSRRRATQQRADKREREFEKVVTTISLLKETVDGLRIYFDNILIDYLLYKEEREYASSFLTKEFLEQFSYLSTRNQAELHLPRLPDFSDAAGYDPFYQTDAPYPAGFNQQQQHKNLYKSTLSFYVPLQQPMTPTQHSKQMRSYLHNVLSWRILPRSAKATPSMLFGAPHLARLLVRLPEFLNCIPMSDDKLKTILQHLESVANYLEDRNECFDESNYVTKEFVVERLEIFRNSAGYYAYKKRRRKQAHNQKILLRQVHAEHKKKQKLEKLINAKREINIQKLEQRREKREEKQKQQQQKLQQQLQQKQQQLQLQQQQQLQQQLEQQQQQLQEQQRQLQNKKILEAFKEKEKEQQQQQQQEQEIIKWKPIQNIKLEPNDDDYEVGACALVIEEEEERLIKQEVEIEDNNVELEVEKDYINIYNNLVRQEKYARGEAEEQEEEHNEYGEEREKNLAKLGHFYNEQEKHRKNNNKNDHDGVDNNDYKNNNDNDDDYEDDEMGVDGKQQHNQNSWSSSSSSSHNNHHHYRQYRQQYQVLQEPISSSQQDHPQLKIRIKTSRVVS